MFDNIKVRGEVVKKNGLPILIAAGSFIIRWSIKSGAQVAGIMCLYSFEKNK